MKTAQNISYEEVEPEFVETPEAASRARPRSAVGLFVLAMLLSGVAAGLGVYAWQLVSEKRQLKSDVAKLEQVRDEAQVRVAQLVEQNGQEQARAAQSDTEREQLRTALAAANAQLDQLQAQSQASQEQLAEFQALRAKFQRMIDSGELDISYRRGRMIVEMPAAVLFDSGSAELSDAGKQTVIQVAKILRNVPKHRFLVGGHTDNVPVAKQYESNWELSAARAVRVTETLTSQGVSPKRLVIAGYSEYDPVATNANESGRRKNRRIEIILEPYVEQKLVKDLLESKAAKK
ncbi:MAG TPA: OmpA family protein [Polyangiaceae bacterium]|nr:OmpA family protein [Polyangiaceae bacterium]